MGTACCVLSVTYFCTKLLHPFKQFSMAEEYKKQKQQEVISESSCMKIA